MKKTVKQKNRKKPTKKEKTQTAVALTGRPSIAPTRAERGSVFTCIEIDERRD
jgi:hypothetical protein